MDLISRKYKFMEQFMKIASVEKIEKLERFFKREILEDSNNQFDELPNVAKRLLERSKKEILEGKYKSHEQVMKESRAKYKTS